MRYVIVGGVAGGAGTAARLRRNDENAEIILCERGEFISFANCGLPYYVGGVIEQEGALQLQTPESFHRRFRVDVRTNCEVTAVFPERHAVELLDHLTEKRMELTYDKLVLSPGANPVRPPIPGADAPHVLTLRNIPDTMRISERIACCAPASCAVIGGGFVGLELAENLARRGLSVSLIEAADHVLAPLDIDMAGAVHTKLRSLGIALYLGRRCVSIEADSITLDDGTRVDARTTVLSVGVAPETAFLAGSGITLGARGEILVDSELRTSEPDIFALGDAACVTDLVLQERTLIPLAGPANKQARICADNLCGRHAVYEGSIGTAVVKLGDMTVASVGANEAALKKRGIAYRKTITCSASHAGYYPGGEMMDIKLLFAPEGRILGAQITGGSGVDKRIDSIAGVLRFSGTVFDLQRLELAYAPPYSSAKDPVNMAGFVAGNVLEGKMKPFYVEDIPAMPADAYFLDVRTSDEFARGAIPGTMNIPLDELREHLTELPRDKTVYLTCQIGLRGYLAQRILEQNGFTTLNLSGGYRFYSSCRTEIQK